MIQNSNNSTTSIIIIGNGMAANRLVNEILKRHKLNISITLIGEEPYQSYNRIMLSAVLAGDFSEENIIYNDDAWYLNNGIELIKNTRITKVNRAEKFIESASGEKYHYDQLIIATGSRPSEIPAKNQNIENIFSFRTLEDTHRILEKANTARSAVVIGGGLLGLEAAYGLAKAGVKVTLVHRSQWLLNRQLDKQAGKMLENVMRQMNIDFRLSTEVDKFNGTDKVSSAELKSGEILAAELVVIATGITPNAEIGEECGLNGERAILVNDYMQTRDEFISALGECVEHNQKTFGLVDPIWRQAETLATRLVDETELPFQEESISTKLKVSGVQVFSAGKVSAAPGDQELCVTDPKSNIYRKLILNNNRITGIVLFGDVSSGPFYFEQMQNKIDVSAIVPNIVFGEEFFEANF